MTCASLFLISKCSSEDMQRTIGGLRAWIEQRKWFDAKAAAIRLRYQQGIDRAAKKWLDNNI